MPLADLIRRVGIPVQTFYGWKKPCAGMQSDRMREHERLQTRRLGCRSGWRSRAWAWRSCRMRLRKCDQGGAQLRLMREQIALASPRTSRLICRARALWRLKRKNQSPCVPGCRPDASWRKCYLYPRASRC
ncbi:hypothetical protein [Burkholderia gladioli]|uniref:hypothetical protein n=1 Tax=Burkholderia gladioli TaxID=28095 RepID=UPI003C7B7E97